MAAKVKKGDKVQIMVGKDRGQRGTVLRVLPDKGKVIVEELNMVKKHQKPGQGTEVLVDDVTHSGADLAKAEESQHRPWFRCPGIRVSHPAAIRP